MAAPASVLTHGAAGIILLSDEVTRSLSDADTGHLEYLVPARDSITPGSEAPEFTGMTVHEVSTRSEADEFVARCRVSGLMTGSGTSKQTKLAWSEDPHGWDVAQVEKIAPRGANHNWASKLSGNSNMRLLARAEEDQLDDRWSRFSLQYRGIRAAGLVSRSTAVNGNIVQPGQPIIVSLPPVINPARKVNASFPRITLTEATKSTFAPPTDRIPSVAQNTLSGFGFPPVRILPISGSDLAANWPWGWVYADIQSQELYAGAGLWIITVTYEYVPQYQF